MSSITASRRRGRLIASGAPRGRPTGHRFAGCPDLRRGGRFLGPRGVLDPSGCADPGRGEGEESVSIFRNPRRLGPGEALTRVSAVLLRGHCHTDHPSTGRCKAKWGGASEQNCTPQCVIPAVATASSRSNNRHEKSPAPKCGASLAIRDLCNGEHSPAQSPPA
jgi:hypothetical protein